MGKISTIYIKNISEINEIFKENSKLPNFVKRVIWVFKRLFCVITIKENGICILPYRDINSFFKIKTFFIKKIIKKLNPYVVLSKELEGNLKFRNSLLEAKIKILDGRKLASCLTLEIIEYICKMNKEELKKQEITILVQNNTSNTSKLIFELANAVKRLQIVTPRLQQFQRLENELENKFGIACQITNNKRKSLLKSKIIVNLDYLEEQLNQFSINPKAIVIDINKNAPITSKAFCGIYIQDYQIRYNKLNIDDNIFDKKLLYEAKIIGKTYEQTYENICKDNVKVINLIGKNGIIHQSEYARIKEN